MVTMDTVAGDVDTSDMSEEQREREPDRAGGVGGVEPPHEYEGIPPARVINVISAVRGL